MLRSMNHILVSALFLGCLVTSVPAQTVLGSLFQDHMVIQAEMAAPMFGTDAPGTVVEARASWEETVRATTDASGRWLLHLHPPKDEGPHTITVRGSSEIVLKDVLSGDVWVCGGQSNMEWTMGPHVGKGILNHEAELAAVKHPRIRLIDVPNVAAAVPLTHFRGQWQKADGPHVAQWSAVAWFFARDLQAVTGRPVGLITTCWGGTSAEVWTSAGALRKHGGFEDALNAVDPSKPAGNGMPSALWNGMVAPLIPAAIRGVIFYQGEANRSRWQQYRTLFPALIADWRSSFGCGEFPFLYVQIAPYRYENDKGEAARLREAQAMCEGNTPRTAMVCTMDIGEPGDIHPLNKQDVGKRLAAQALVHAYGREVAHRGPRYRSIAVEGSVARVSMDVGSQRMLARDGRPLTHFEVAGVDRVFHAATARIDGSSLLVESKAVPAPVAVRYAFSSADIPNLQNDAGFPASSFRSDDWPLL
jgi:sialate O-acetylesterase